jgi:hypothetical protein
LIVVEYPVAKISCIFRHVRKRTNLPIMNICKKRYIEMRGEWDKRGNNF